MGMPEGDLVGNKCRKIQAMVRGTIPSQVDFCQDRRGEPYQTRNSFYIYSLSLLNYGCDTLRSCFDFPSRCTIICIVSKEKSMGNCESEIDKTISTPIFMNMYKER